MDFKPITNNGVDEIDVEINLRGDLARRVMKAARSARREPAEWAADEFLRTLRRRTEAGAFDIKDILFGDELAKWRSEGRKRNISDVELLGMVMKKIVDDDLVKAILDD